MIGPWDSIDQLRANDELGTAAVELIIALAAISVIIVLMRIQRRYQKYNANGFPGLIAGFGLFAAHFVCDFIDTITAKKVAGETTAFYTAMDRADASLAFIGLFVIGFAFLQIAQYGMQLWEESE